MKKVRIGKSTLKGSQLAYGCWRIAGTWDGRKVKANDREAGVKAILAAHEADYTFLITRIFIAMASRRNSSGSH